MNKLKENGSIMCMGSKLPGSGMGHDEFLLCSEFEGGQRVVSRFRIDSLHLGENGPVDIQDWETTCVGQIVYEAPEDEFSIPQGGGKSSHPLAVEALSGFGL